jgi:mRNA interferase RelE/StbE
MGDNPASRRYRVELTARAVGTLGTLPRKDQERIARRIDALAADPRPSGCRKLEGADDLFRIRSGDYRIVYQVRDDALIVVVVRIGNRRDVYRGL